MFFVFYFLLVFVVFFNKFLSFFCVVFFIEVVGFIWKFEFYGRECCNNNWVMRDFFKYCKRKGLLIELGGEVIFVIRLERGLVCKLVFLKIYYLIRICYV